MTGELQPAGHPANNAANQSVSFASNIDQTDRLASGCPVDVAFTVSGVQWNIPFSGMCDKLRLVGNAMVGVFMLIALLIVFRS
ncbi:virulence factor TspB C-terminal domain-related protein [Roseateles sp. BYS78W]|uniref:Virulence factor TspB C-terminal domain-related protein n=1 Tax=Pelomonas candidula TaxID=3299025 RepID=A0ABW7H5U2_9BURK